jgi:hypothetical protein
VDDVTLSVIDVELVLEEEDEFVMVVDTVPDSDPDELHDSVVDKDGLRVEEAVVELDCEDVNETLIDDVRERETLLEEVKFFDVVRVTLRLSLIDAEWVTDRGSGVTDGVSEAEPVTETLVDVDLVTEKDDERL